MEKERTSEKPVLIPRVSSAGRHKGLDTADGFEKAAVALGLHEVDRVEVSSAAKAAKEVGLRIDGCVETSTGRTAEVDTTPTVLRRDA